MRLKLKPLETSCTYHLLYHFTCTRIIAQQYACDQLNKLNKSGYDVTHAFVTLSKLGPIFSCNLPYACTFLVCIKLPRCYYKAQSHKSVGVANNNAILSFTSTALILLRRWMKFYVCHDSLQALLCSVACHVIKYKTMRVGRGLLKATRIIQIYPVECEDSNFFLCFLNDQSEHRATNPTPNAVNKTRSLNL